MSVSRLVSSSASSADVVTLHLPLIKPTKGMIDADALARLERNAILINAARGGIIDEEALAAALAAGRLAGAAIDVYAEEPPDSDSPLLNLDTASARNVLFTPHIAGVTRQAWAGLFSSAWENVERVLLRAVRLPVFVG